MFYSIVIPQRMWKKFRFYVFLTDVVLRRGNAENDERECELKWRENNARGQKGETRESGSSAFWNFCNRCERTALSNPGTVIRREYTRRMYEHAFPLAVYAERANERFALHPRRIHDAKLLYDRSIMTTMNFRTVSGENRDLHTFNRNIIL